MPPSLTLEISSKNANHDVVLSKLKDRIVFSKAQRQERSAKWTKNEEAVRAYMPERDVDAIRRMDREIGGKPQFTTLVLPYTYGALMSAHTYWTTVFMSRSPVLQYSGRHGESEQATQAIEALVDYQVQVGEMLVPLYIWLLDVGKYGEGAISEYWCEESSIVSSVIEETEKLFGIMDTGKKRRVKVQQRVPGYVGNKLSNIRPHDFFPDPRVPLHMFQTGEFCGRYFELGWNEILKREQDGYYTNLDELKKGANKFQASDKDPGSAQLNVPNQSDIFGRDIHNRKTSDLFKGYEICVELVPDDWGFGSSKYPEKWMFTATSDWKYLIGAQPLGYQHNKFPYNVLVMEPEGYGLNNRGLPEILDPIQRTMDWLVNAHFYNVRKTINNQFLVDPSRVTMKDVLDPMAGGVIRAKPAAYGTDMRTAMHQLQVMDITRTHMTDMGLVQQMGEKYSGINEQIMGMAATSSRRSATEIRTSSTFGTNRLKTSAEYFSAMGWAPMSSKIVQNSQQYYDMERKFKVVGDLAQMAGPKFIQVRQDDIQGFFDFVPVDGTLPVDRFAQANLWGTLLSQMQKYPQIMAEYDIGKIFAWVAQLGGLKNINQFKINMQDPEAIQKEVARGNLVAIQGGAASGGQTPAPRIAPQQPPMTGTSG